MLVVGPSAIRPSPAFVVILHSKVLKAIPLAYVFSACVNNCHEGRIHLVPVNRHFEIFDAVWQSTWFRFITKASNWLKWAPSCPWTKKERKLTGSTFTFVCRNLKTLKLQWNLGLGTPLFKNLALEKYSLLVFVSYLYWRDTCQDFTHAK